MASINPETGPVQQTPEAVTSSPATSSEQLHVPAAQHASTEGVASTSVSASSSASVSGDSIIMQLEENLRDASRSFLAALLEAAPRLPGEDVNTLREAVYEDKTVKEAEARAQEAQAALLSHVEDHAQERMPEFRGKCEKLLKGNMLVFHMELEEQIENRKQIKA